MTNTATNPANVYAVVVGIEKYQAGSDYDLDGPAKDALDFCNWLLDHEVDPEHIYLFLSPLDENRRILSVAEGKGMTPLSATHVCITSVIHSQLTSESSKGSLLYVFWGGHGIITRTGTTVRRLFFEDTDDNNKWNLNFNSLVDALSTSAFGAGFSQQVFLIDACANLFYKGLFQNMQAEASEIKFAANGEEKQAEQIVLFASQEYGAATNDSSRGTGYFSRTVLEKLQGKPLLPEMETIESELRSDLLKKHMAGPASYYSKIRGKEIKETISGTSLPPKRSPTEERTQQAVIHCLEHQIRASQSIRLPFAHRDRGQSLRPILTEEPIVAVPIASLYLDLPLITKRNVFSGKIREEELESGNLTEQQTEESSPLINLSAVDRTERGQFSQIREVACRLKDELKPEARLVVRGDPGCGKTTLLSFLTYHYAQRQLRRISPQHLLALEETAAAHESLPRYDWFPMTILCRDLLDAEINDGMSGLIKHHLKQFGLGKNDVPALTDFLEQEIPEGKVLLLIDGLDEIPTEEQRWKFANLIARQANFYAQMPIVITSRVVGLVQIQSLLNSFSYFKVAPLETSEQQQFIGVWAALKAYSDQDAISIKTELEALVCDNPKVARLCNTVFLLALTAQIYLQDQELPDRIVDVYRRAVELMIERQRDGEGLPLSREEVYPHIEHLAYCMHSEGAQHWVEPRVIQAIEKVRQQERRRKKLSRRTCEEWLQAVIERLGLLNIVGISLDRRGDEDYVIQMFHQSFQEYFAAQALLHSRGDYDETEPLEHLRRRVRDLKIEEQKIEFIGSGQRTEPVIADQWEEVVRLCIDVLCQAKDAQERLGIASADDVILLMLPSPEMPSKQARAFATFALECLAENEPDVTHETVEAVLDAALYQITELERFISKANRGTAICEAFKAIAQSRFGELCRKRLLQHYIQTRDYCRFNIGVVFLNLLQCEILTEENADLIVASYLEKLTIAESVEAAIEGLLRLTETFWRSPKDLLLPHDLLHRTISELLTTIETRTSSNEALSVAAMWALIWILNAPSGSSHVYQFTEAELERLCQLARDNNRDALVRSQSAMLLGLYSSEKTVFAQTNWVYEWAVVADGHKPHKRLPQAVVADRPKEIETLKSLIASDLPEESKRTVALALGRLGCFSSDMVQPLIQILQDDLSSEIVIEESIVYLALTGEPEVTPLLVQQKSDLEDSTTRGSNLDELRFLALIGLGDLALLRHQLRLGEADQVDLNAYAYALAGAENPRGRQILRSDAIQKQEALSTTANSALNKLDEWYASSQSTSNSTKLHAGRHVSRYIAKRGHLIHKLKAKDSTGRWAYYFILVRPSSEQEFLQALKSNREIDLEKYGFLVASNYGEAPSEEVRAMLKEKYDFNV